MYDEKLFIEIEGMDGVGKNTQSNKLLNYYLEKGMSSRIYSFPDYELQSGKSIIDYLHGKFKSSEGFDDAFIKSKSLTYAINRAESLLFSDDGLPYNNHDVIIFDRYVFSNLIHNAHYFETDEALIDYMEYLRHIEFNELKLPEPNVIIFLSVEPEVSLTNIINRGRERDDNETIDHLTKVYNNMTRVKHILSRHYRIIDIDCTSIMEGSPVMKSKEEIHEAIQLRLQELNLL